MKKGEKKTPTPKENPSVLRRLLLQMSHEVLEAKVVRRLEEGQAPSCRAEMHTLGQNTGCLHEVGTLVQTECLPHELML